MKKNPTATLCVTLMMSVLSSQAATLFWDANGAAGCGGAGNWANGSGAFWGTACDTGLTTWNNANVDSATLSGTGATVTLTSGITVNKITVQATGYILSGGSILTFSGTGAGIDWNTAGSSFQLSCPYAGSLLTKTGSGRVNLNNSSSTISKYLVQGGEISTAAVNRFGTAPGRTKQIPQRSHHGPERGVLLPGAHLSAQTVLRLTVI